MTNTPQKKPNPDGMVQWSEELSYGIEGMDNDHKVMINLVNRMHAIANNQEEDFDIKQLLAKLADYAILHFRREEIVMETCQYPGYDSHINYHHELELQVFELLKNKDKPFSPHETDELLHFLSNWLFEHISVVDQTLTPYVAKYVDEIDEALKKTTPVADVI